MRGLLLSVGLLGSGVRPASPQAAGGVAVLPLEDTGSYGQDKELFEGLDLGLGDMLGRALEQRHGVEVVSPSRVRRSLVSQRHDRRIDAAAKVE